MYINSLKRSVFLIAIIFSIVLLGNTLNAQNSEEGTPYSFNNHLRESTIPNLYPEILPPFDLALLQYEDAINDLNNGAFRFGYNHAVNYNLNNSGVWITLPNGDRLWQLSIKSPEAVSLNLAFDDFFMPDRANLFVYSADKKNVIGAFTDLNNQDDNAFATDLITGDAVILEYYEPASVAKQGRLQLFRVTHGYRGLKDHQLAKAFGASGACQYNVNCSLGTDWQDQKNAVIFLITEGNLVCTGTLLNNVPETSKPYVLTANHCGSGGYSTWVFRFNWEAPTCSNPASNPSSKSLTGCVKRAAYPKTDMSLVEITGGLIGMTVPANYNPYFAGWSAVNTPATSTVCIHHPNGDIKKISEAANTTISSTSFSAPPEVGVIESWRVSQWTSGTTEPGSSGSPLFDQNKRVIGQLAGGPSGCGEASFNLNDYFGKFSTSWLGGGTPSTQLKYWLDPDTTGITTMDGTDSLLFSVGEIKSKDNLSFSIYPNPNTGNFTIETKLLSPEIINIKVVDLLGQIMYMHTLPKTGSSTYSIDIDVNASGFYFLELSTTKERHVKKVNIIK